MGNLLGQDWGTPPPSDRTAGQALAVGGIPLAFTQEDYIVSILKIRQIFLFRIDLQIDDKYYCKHTISIQHKSDKIIKDPYIFTTHLFHSFSPETNDTPETITTEYEITMITGKYPRSNIDVLLTNRQESKKVILQDKKPIIMSC